LNSHKSEKINEQLQDSSNEEQKIHGVNDKIEKRRHQVWTLFIQGFSLHQIAKKLDVCTKTISRDFKELKKQSVEWMDALPKGEIQMYYRSIQETLEKIIQELWEFYDKTDDQTVKITILKDIAEQRKQFAEVLNPTRLLNIRATIHKELRYPYFFEDKISLQRPPIDYEKL